MLGDQCLKMSAPYNWVDTDAQLEHLTRFLGEEKAFAVDTEQQCSVLPRIYCTNAELYPEGRLFERHSCIA